MKAEAAEVIEDPTRNDVPLAAVRYRKLGEPIMSDRYDLDGQVAVISGAGRGIGRAIATAYGRFGMRIVCAARNKEQIEETAATIKLAGGVALAQVCDVTETDQVDALFATASQTFGGVDLVLVNAGTAGDRGTIETSDMDDWRRTLELNLFAAYAQSRAAIPYLRARGGGKILFMGSGVGRNAMPGTSSYACSKAGVAMLCRVLARELREDNIAVNEIIPGPVRTEMTGVPEEWEVDDAKGSPILRVPGEWIKNPPEVAPLALFLASLPNYGPSGQSYSLTGRDLGRI
jgi:3-oxoacyl-[acyl-carrier protein] reductase